MTLFGSSHLRKAKRPAALGKYDRKREAERRRQATQSASGRDIGTIPPCADPTRRDSCERNLLRFCTTYNPETFCLPWSDDHKLAGESIEQTTFVGALLAMALARGSGKTSLCRMAVLWAASYAHAAYCFLLGANWTKGQEAIEAIQTWMRTLPAYAEDFPEISVAARYLRGQANRAGGMICCGEPAFAHWEKDRIVLPRVPHPPNVEGLLKGPWAKTSGGVIGAAGLTAEGIRGAVFAHPDGRSIRPDLLLIDDPQSDETAASPHGVAKLLRLLNGAVLGMAGPGRSISAFMPLTVNRAGDAADKILDRKTNALWRGIRTGMLRSMPKNLAAWEAYYDVYRACMGQTIPDLKPANRHYRKHRKELDEGAEASWPARKKPEEISAIQHAMDLRCTIGEEAFSSEYQNAPRTPQQTSDLLTTDGLASRLNQLDRRVLAPKVQHVTCHVDVGDQILWWTAAGWQPDFTGQVADYGTWPEQPAAVRYFPKRNPPRKLRDLYPKAGKEGAVLAGLTDLVEALAKLEFRREDGAVLKLGKILIDGRYDRDLVMAFCRRSPHAALLLPAMGFAMPKGREWSGYFAGKEGGQTGFHWRIPPAKDGGRYVLVDPWWKTLAWERLRVSQGDPGCWSIFGRKPGEHAMLFDHYCSEKPIWTVAKDLGKYEWELAPNRDNDWWDNLIGCACGASMLGVAIPGIVVRRSGWAAAAAGHTVSLAEMQQASRRGKG